VTHSVLAGRNRPATTRFRLPPASRSSGRVKRLLKIADQMQPGLERDQPLGDYRMIPLLAFFSRKATSKACICPLLRWMTETTSECCMLAMLMPLTNKLVTL